MPANRRDASPSEINDRDIRAVVAEAITRGWVLERGGSGHLLLRWDASPEAVWLSATSKASRGRGLSNLKAAIARIERDGEPPN